MLTTVRRFLELIRFSHTVFALPFALISALLAWHAKGSFHWIELVGILLCLVFARSAAMAFNRLVDRDFDAQNPRTRGRHLPAGLLSVPAVLAFTVFCSVGFIASTAIFLVAEPSNPWPIYLSVPVLIFLCAYSLTKRFTSLAHFWLGASLLLAPVSAWIAIRGMTDMAVPLVLGAAVLFWVAGFDVLYACQDTEFDQHARLHSIPAKIGVPAALRLAAVCHLLMWSLLFALYFQAHPPLGTVFLIGVFLVGALLAYEHWLVRPSDLTRVNQAFFQVNAVISIGLLGLVIVELAIR